MEPIIFLILPLVTKWIADGASFAFVTRKKQGSVTITLVYHTYLRTYISYVYSTSFDYHKILSFTFVPSSAVANHLHEEWPTLNDQIIVSHHSSVAPSFRNQDTWQEEWVEDLAAWRPIMMPSMIRYLSNLSHWQVLWIIIIAILSHHHTSSSRCHWQPRFHLPRPSYRVTLQGWLGGILSRVWR